jgi:hypothetical protein
LPNSSKQCYLEAIQGGLKITFKSQLELFINPLLSQEMFNIKNEALINLLQFNFDKLPTMENFESWNKIITNSINESFAVQNLDIKHHFDTMTYLISQIHSPILESFSICSKDIPDTTLFNSTNDKIFNLLNIFQTRLRSSNN